MSSDHQFTAKGQAAIGFQTDPSDGGPIDRGAYIVGNTYGILGGDSEEMTNPSEQRGLLPQKGTGVQGNGSVVGVVGQSQIAAISGPTIGLGEPIEKGVGVYGRGGVVGVYGESLSGPYAWSHSSPLIPSVTNTNLHLDESDPTKPNIGVFGIGTDAGIQGKSINGDGVQGFNYTQSYNNSQALGSGVYGQSDEGTGVSGQSRNGNGVYGHSGDLSPYYKHSVRGAGVFGESVRGDGVCGISTEGPGLHGESGGDRGGTFQSDLVAQVQLLPAPFEGVPPFVRKPRPLPAEAKAGDLFARLVEVRVSSGLFDVTEPRAELWFCVQPTDAEPNVPVLWSKVMLEPPVPPT